jgi:hypothetical protein
MDFAAAAKLNFGDFGIALFHGGKLAFLQTNYDAG